MVGFATGGQVPGIGNTDIVPAMLTPGEVVINKNRSALFMPFLEMINYAPLDKVMKVLGQHLNTGGIVMPRIQMPTMPTLAFNAGGQIPNTNSNTGETFKFEWKVGNQADEIETLRTGPPSDIFAFQWDLETNVVMRKQSR